MLFFLEIVGRHLPLRGGGVWAAMLSLTRTGIRWLVATERGVCAVLCVCYV